VTESASGFILACYGVEGGLILLETRGQPVSWTSETRSSHPRSSVNRRRRAFAPFSGFGARSLLDHFSLCSHRSEPRADQPTELQQRQRQTVASGHGRCRGFCSKGQWGMIALVFTPITQVQ
jgi:hypothetical protein